MKTETRTWLNYADENLESAKALVKKKLYNPCLQNTQQAVEKSMKALLIEISGEFKRTHSIGELKRILDNKSIEINISEEEIILQEGIYHWGPASVIRLTGIK